MGKRKRNLIGKSMIQKVYMFFAGGVQRTFVIILFGAILIPFCVISFVSLHNMSREAETQYLEEKRISTANAAIYFENYFQSIDSVGISVYYDKIFYDSIGGVATSFSSQKEQERYNENRIGAIWHSIPNARTVTCRSSLKDYEITYGVNSLGLWNIVAFSETPYHTFFYEPDCIQYPNRQFVFYALTDETDTYLGYFRKLYNHGRIPIGDLYMIIDMEKIREAAKSFCASEDENILIYSTAVDAFLYSTAENETDLAVRQELEKDENQNVISRDPIRLNITGKDDRMFLYALPEYEMVICKTLPAVSDHTLFGEQLGSTFILYLAVILLALVLTVGLSKTITIPIQKLTKALDRIQHDEFGIAIPVGRGHNEINAVIEKFNQMSAEIDHLINEKLIATIHIQELKLMALQATINPHFIANTLQPIGKIALEYNAYDVKYMLDAFCGIMRYSLKSDETYATVQEEMEYLQKYLLIQKLRLGDSFDFSLHYTEETESFRIPRMTLQPLAENVICYGFGEKVERVHMEVDARIENGVLVMSVIDDGAGFQCDVEKMMEQLTDKGKPVGERITGIGLSNVNGRLEMLFGDRYSISITSEPEVRTCVCIKIVLEDKNHETPDCR